MDKKGPQLINSLSQWIYFYNMIIQKLLSNSQVEAVNDPFLNFNIRKCIIFKYLTL